MTESIGTRQKDGRGKKNDKKKVTKSISVTGTKTWCHTATCRPKFKASEAQPPPTFYYYSLDSQNYPTPEVSDQSPLLFGSK